MNMIIFTGENVNILYTELKFENFMNNIFAEDPKSRISWILYNSGESNLSELNNKYDFQ